MAITIDEENGKIILGGGRSQGELKLLGGIDQQRISLNAVTANILAGGRGKDGDLVLHSENDEMRIRLDAASAGITAGGHGAAGSLKLLSSSVRMINTPDNTLQVVEKTSIHLDGDKGDIIVGGPSDDPDEPGVSGDLFLRTSTGIVRIRLDGNFGTASLGGQGSSGNLLIFSRHSANATWPPAGGSPEPQPAIHLNGESANILVGGPSDDPDGQGTSGDLFLRNEEGKNRLHLNAGLGRACIGGNGADGKLFLFSTSGDNMTTSEATIHLNGGNGEIKVKDTIHLNGGSGEIKLKDTIHLNGGNGEIKVKDSLRYIDGSLRLGSGGHDGTLLLRDSNGDETIRVDGRAGDIILSNADCAEDFDLASGEDAVPGAVMVLGEDGSLRQSEQEYDSAVAGVVSGAGSYRPGLILDRCASDRPRVPLAMVGKVFCMVDADFGAVRPGTLLTTSPRRGHAMRAADPTRAFGAVIGKALKPLERGQALIPIMVTLQ